MTGPRSHLVRFGSVVVLTTALVLMGALWLVGTHDHASSISHPCAVCTTAHTPAEVGIVVTGIAAPRPIAACVVARALVPPASIAIGIAPSRAPPRA